MRNVLPFLFWLVCSLSFAQTTPPSDLEGDQLKSWLKENWHQGKHAELGYSEARRQMYSQIDVRTDGRVYCVYTGYSQPAANTTFLDPINCEHTVPQSFFGEAEPMKSDIHHLFPTHGTANTARLNYAFGDIPDQLTDLWFGTDASNNFIGTEAIPTSSAEGYAESEAGRFEPREDHKGDVARAIFYYYTMYPGTASDISRIVVGGKVEALYAWHLQDPVSAWEIQRNDRIEAVQGNRNPYIDYPDLVCRAFNLSCGSGYLYIKNSLPVVNAYQGQPSATFSFSLAGENISEPVVLSADTGFYLTLNGSEYVKTLSLSPASLNEQMLGVRFDTSGVGVGVYSGVLQAMVEGRTIVLDTLQGEVISEGDSQLLAFESFDDGNWELRGWEVVNKSSNRNWGYTEEGFEESAGIEMNGYNGDAGSDDWLISPTIDLGPEASHIEFMAYSHYGGAEALSLLVSENYSPSTDPELAEWVPLTSSLPDGGSRSWKNTVASLAAYQGKSVTLAFHYNASADYPSWVLDNFKVLTGDIVVPYAIAISSSNTVVEPNTASTTVLEVTLDRPAEKDVRVSFHYAESAALPEPVTTQPAMADGVLELTIPAGSTMAEAEIQAPAYKLESQVVVTFTLQQEEYLDLQGKDALSLTFKEYIIAPYIVTLTPATVSIKADQDTSFTLVVALERKAENEVRVGLAYAASAALPTAIQTEPTMTDNLLQLSISEGDSTAVAQIKVPALQLQEEQTASFSILETDQINKGEQPSISIVFLPYEEVVQGIEAMSLAEWQVGPNPTSGIVFVKSQTKQLASIRLVSATGHQLDEQLPNEQGRLDLSHLPPGMYVLLIQEANGKLHQTRVVKY